MSMSMLVAMAIAITPLERQTQNPKQRTPLGKAIYHESMQCEATAKPRKNCMTKAKAEKLAKLFRRFGKQWGSDPWLGVCVARRESHFLVNPSKIIWHCVVIGEGKARKQICRNLYAGEVGIMQLIPYWAKDSFKACYKLLGANWRHMSRPDVNICAGMHALRRRQTTVEQREQKGWGFLSRGSSSRWSSRFRPCGRYQVGFCANPKYRELCKRYWWVASYNWGTHRRICWSSYPMSILRCYRRLTRRFRYNGQVKQQAVATMGSKP